MEQENKPNLIKKLKALLHGKKLSQKLATLVLATSIAIIPLTACSNNNNNVTPNTPPSQNQQQGGNEQNNNQYSEYSPLLQSVLTSSYYNTLINQAKVNTDMFDSAKFDPHPYKFLQDQGHDIDAIKNGNLECYTISYVLDEEPNNLYISTRVENPGDYYTNYLVKYELTDKEMEDYNLTHQLKNSAVGYYIQAVFMNDAISKAKTPTIISNAKINKTTFTELQNSIGGLNSTKEMTGNKLNKIIFMNLQAKNFDVYAYPNISSYEDMTHNVKLAFIPCMASNNIQNSIFYGPTNYGNYWLTNEFSKSNTKDIKLYSPQGSRLHYVYCEDLTN